MEALLTGAGFTCTSVGLGVWTSADGRRYCQFLPDRPVKPKEVILWGDASRNDPGSMYPVTDLPSLLATGDPVPDADGELPQGDEKGGVLDELDRITHATRWARSDEGGRGVGAPPHEDDL